jgi:hypothetical protein
MAKSRVPILADGLTLPERVMLIGLTRHVGFPVLVKLIVAACENATLDINRADPEAENYERILSARQQKSRAFQEFARDIQDSIEYHKSLASQQTDAEELDNHQLQIGE